MNTANKTEKLRAMIVFVLRKLPGKLNRVALCKNLYYSEMHYYQRFGKTISGVDYLHIEASPVPRHFNELISEMVTRKEITVVPQVAPEVIDGRQIMVLRGMVFQCDAPLLSVLTRVTAPVLRFLTKTSPAPLVSSATRLLASL